MSGHDKQCAVTAARASAPGAVDVAVGERVAAPGPSKKCSQCSRDRSESSFSNAQLKLKGRRQCRDCIDPICMVCGKGDSARASGAPPASPATSTLRPLLVRRPQPAADFLILSHYSCAEMLSGRVDQNVFPPAIAGVPAGLCAILASHCAHCDRDGGALQCGGCSRVYHGACGGAVKFAKLKEGTVYPSNMVDCLHCTPPHAPLPPSAPSDPTAVSICAACGLTDGGFAVTTDWTRSWDRLQPVHIEMKPTELLLPMHIGCARQLTALHAAQLVMPPADSDNAPLLKNLSEHLQSTISGSCAGCHSPGGTTRCSDCSSCFHHVCLSVQLNRTDEEFATAPMSNCPVCTQSLQIIDQVEVDAAFAAKALAAASITGASSAAAATSFSSSSSSAASASSSSAIPAGSKKCAQCQQHLPDSDYSGVQLKAKGKPQCKSCVASAQSLQAVAPGPVDEETKMIRSRLAVLTPRLRSPLESEQREALCALGLLLQGMNDARVPFHIVDAAVATRLVELTAASIPSQLRTLALGCITMVVLHLDLQSPFIAALAQSAGALRFFVVTLQQPQSHGDAHKMCLQVLEHIAAASRSNCDALLAAGALPALVRHVRADLDSELRDMLFSTLVAVLRRRTTAVAAPGVARIATVLMDGATPPELLRTCLSALRALLVSFAEGDPNVEPWAESFVNAAPGFPRRLVELLSDARPNVAGAAQMFMIILFRANTLQLQRLFDCGLLDKLLQLLNDANEPARLGAVNLCTNAAGNKAGALALIDSAPVVERMLALLADSDVSTQQCAFFFFANAMSHLDRRVTRRLVDDYRFLRPIVAALRGAIQTADQTVILWCLRTVADVLTVGKAEAADDERGVNPYIEPLDWEGVFELAGPLQSSSNSEMAAAARRVFGYFIPNDCD